MIDKLVYSYKDVYTAVNFKVYSVWIYIENFIIIFSLGADGTTILWERSKEEVMTATLDLTLIHPHEHDELHRNHHHQVVGEDFEDHSENSSDCSDSTSSQESSDTAEKELYGPTSAAETAAIAASNSPADAQQDRLSCSKAAASNICVINSLIASLES